MNQKTFEEIANKIRATRIPGQFDLVVAVGRGGVVPAWMLAQKLSLPMEILWMRYRDDRNEIEREHPVLARPFHGNVHGMRVLLVDDVSRTGSTIRAAKHILEGASVVKTFVVNGEADYALYNEECSKLPWIL